MKKRVLITGETSYLGQVCAKHLRAQDMSVRSLSLRQETWKETTFEDVDHLIHVAGIAHVSYKKNEDSLYDDINHRLTLEVAKKAKQEGVKHFIFFSTMLVLGEHTRLPLSKDTKPNPKNPYSLSKYHAEVGLHALADEHFVVTILRLPFVYGPNAKGNYAKLSKLAQKLPVFLKTNNQRTMLYVGNLSYWIESLIKNPVQGTIYPQNDEPVNTSTLFKTIRTVHGKKTYLIPGFGSLLRHISVLHPTLRKLFASQVYAKDTRIPLNVPDQVSFVDSIYESEGFSR